MTLDEAIDALPVGAFHYRLLAMCGAVFMADAMEVSNRPFPYVSIPLIANPIPNPSGKLIGLHLAVRWRRVGPRLRQGGEHYSRRLRR